MGDRGNVDYVYRDAARFPGVCDAESFRVCVEARMGVLVERVEMFRPCSHEEHEDLGYMLEAIADLRTAAELAVRLELERGVRD